jgi:hypothetical protein
VNQPEKRSARSAQVGGLGRLSVLLLASTLGLAVFWHLLYGAGLIAAIVVVGEICVLVAVAFASAWRSVQ